MKIYYKILWVLGFILIGFIIGAYVGKPNITQETCFPICADMFERWGC